MSEESEVTHNDEQVESPTRINITGIVSFNKLEKSSSKLLPVGSTVCRICHTNTANEALISPCNCKGSLAFVHLSCLERWLNQSSRSYCELCMFHYNAIETKRYRLCEGLGLWLRHPRNRAHIQADLLIGSLLTMVTLGLFAVCFLGMDYFIMEGNKIGIGRNWTRNTICLFLALVLCGYIVTVYLLVKDQVVPWYNWWKNTVNVKLLLNSPASARNKSAREEPTQI